MESFEFAVRPEGRVPPLTSEEAESGIVLVQGDDGWYVADTVVDPETGGVWAQPKEGAKPNRIEIVED